MSDRELQASVAIERLARELYNDECHAEGWDFIAWHRIRAEDRRRYRQYAWLCYAEHSEQDRVGTYEADSIIEVDKFDG